MTEIIEVDGKYHELSGKVTDVGIVSITKYVQAFQLDTQVACTEEIATAALKAIKKAFPTLEINDIEGLEDLGFESIGKIVNAILAMYQFKQKQRIAKTISSLNETIEISKEEQIEKLKAQISQLEQA